MLRTQIYLPEDLKQEINILAKRQKKPAAEIIRQLLIGGIKGQHTETVGEAFSKLASIKAKGPADLSTNIDKYLYE